MVGSNDTVIIDNKEIKKTKGNYCFPNFLGKAMGNVGQRVQYESSLISVALILIGIVVMGIVTIFGTDLSSFVKVMAGINCMAAFMFLSSSLITTFQQYQAYLSIMGIMEEEGKDENADKIEKTEEVEIETKAEDIDEHKEKII